jgi:hypothetical protein
MAPNNRCIALPKAKIAFSRVDCSFADGAAQQRSATLSRKPGTAIQKLPPLMSAMKHGHLCADVRMGFPQTEIGESPIAEKKREFQNENPEE